MCDLRMQHHLTGAIFASVPSVLSGVFGAFLRSDLHFSSKLQPAQSNLHLMDILRVEAA